MTKLLDRAVEVARKLPADAQDDIARIILHLAVGEDETPLPLTEEEEAALAVSKAAAAPADFATEEEVRAVWARHGL